MPLLRTKSADRKNEVAYIACAFGAILISAGVLAITPKVAIGVVLLLAVIYASCKAFAEERSHATGPSA